MRLKSHLAAINMPQPFPCQPPTLNQALDYLASKVKGGSRPPGAGPGAGGFQRRTRSRVDEAREILANVVLCHVPVVAFDYQQKVCGWGVLMSLAVGCLGMSRVHPHSCTCCCYASPVHFLHPCR